MVSTRRLFPDMPAADRAEIAQAYRLMRAEGLMLSAKSRHEIVREVRSIFDSEAQPLPER
jgi:hypothetical protein